MLTKKLENKILRFEEETCARYLAYFGQKSSEMKTCMQGYKSDHGVKLSQLAGPFNTTKHGTPARNAFSDYSPKSEKTKGKA